MRYKCDGKVNDIMVTIIKIIMSDLTEPIAASSWQTFTNIVKFFKTMNDKDREVNCNRVDCRLFSVQ